MSGYPFTQTLFRAHCTNVLGSDIVELLVDLGFRVQVRVLVKLAGIQTPQSDSENSIEREEADRARAHLVDWLMPVSFKNIIDLNHWPVQLFARQDMERDVWIGKVRTRSRNNGQDFCVSERLIEMGLGIMLRG